MKSIFVSVAGAFLLVLSTATVSAADLVATASKSSEIRTFVEALRRAGLEQTLKGKGPFTVFAPSNSAFDKLPQQERDSLFKDKKKLARVLTYHVMPGKTVVSEVKPGPTGTLHGETVTLKSDNGMISVNDAKVTLSDLEADNGIIHVVDTVLMPKQ